MPDETLPPSPASGVRLGPMTWVPELREKPNDPWAHRKGEPRPLALLWSLYLMASALVTLLRVRSLTMPTTEQFAFGCRSMVLMVLIGTAVLWPMVRLSQQFPKRPHLSLLGDLLVILVPVQAVVWPMPLLTHWPLTVTAAVAFSVVSWSLLSAGLLAAAFTLGASSPRWCWMLVFLMVACVSPAIEAWWRATLGAGSASSAWLFSPLTAVWGLTAAPSGLTPVMQRSEWALTMMPGLIGAVIWLIAGRFAPAQEAGYSVPGPEKQDEAGRGTFRGRWLF